MWGTAQEALVEANRDLETARAALRTIRGPEDRGVFVEAYRDAGGGYAGLQRVAEYALELIDK